MLRVIAIVSLLAGSAAADPAKPATCKRVVVGHHAVCQIETTIVISAAPPKPAVVIVPHEGKDVTGRPTTGDRLAGLPRQLR